MVDLQNSPIASNGGKSARIRRVSIYMGFDSAHFWIWAEFITFYLGYDKQNWGRQWDKFEWI